MEKFTEVTDFQIYKTNDYKKFVGLWGNRSVTDDRKNKIVQSIKEVGYIPVPIVVNEHYEVIDGQGRLAACEELGLPVYYQMIDGIGLDECVCMNTYSMQWSTMDYIKSYAQQGIKSYMRLLNLMSEYKYSNVIFFYALGYSAKVQAVKSGTFKMSIEQEKYAREMLDYFESVKPFISKFRGRKNDIYIALSKLIINDLIDKERMAESLEKNGEIEEKVFGAMDAVQKLERIYNYNRVKKVYFTDKYRMILSEERV